MSPIPRCAHPLPLRAPPQRLNAACKKSMVLKKGKKEKQAKKNGKAAAAPNAAACVVDCENQDDLDFDKLVEYLTDRMQDKLVGHRDLVNMLLKAFDEDATDTQIHKLAPREN